MPHEDAANVGTLDYSKPVPPRKTFFARPFYRDWVLSAVIIGMGFMLSDHGGPLEGLPGLVVIGIGACIFVAAAVHSVVSVVRRVAGRAA